MPTTVGRDVWREFRLSLAVLALLLYCGGALLPTGLLIYSVVARNGGLVTGPGMVILRVVVDIMLTVGMVFAIRSVRVTDRRASWRQLGWTAVAFVLGFGLLALENAMRF